MRRAVVASAICGAGALWFLARTPALAASSSPAPGHLLPSQLNFLADPTLAFGLLLVALLGIGLELMHPGATVPGTVGLLASALAVAALLDLPLNLFGLVLVAAAVGLFVLDITATSHGVLSVAGIAAAVAGGWLLFRAPGVDPVALVAMPVALGVIWLWLSAKALEVRRRSYPALPQELLGLEAKVMQAAGDKAVVRVEGELWSVVERDGHPLPEGSVVEILAQDGLTLIVRRVLAPQASIENAAPERGAAPGAASEAWRKR